LAGSEDGSVFSPVEPKPRQPQPSAWSTVGSRELDEIMARAHDLVRRIRDLDHRLATSPRS